MREGPGRLIAAAIAILIGCDRQDDFQPVADSQRASMSASTAKAPSNATAVPASDNALEVRWQDNSSNETGFRVYRSTTGPGGQFYLRATTGPGATRYIDSSLSPGTKYCYRVAAFTHGGISGYSNTACATTPAPPRAPTNTVATPQSSSAVEVTWTDNSTNEDGFRLERAAGTTGPWELADTAGRDVTAVVDVARAAELQVCYRVFAFNANGVSAPSNLTCTTPPAAPQALVAIGVDASTIRLSWIDRSAVESGYEVQRSLDQSGPFGAVANLPPNASSYLDVGVGSNTVYWYRLRAIKDGGFSDFGQVASALVAARPAAATDLTATIVGSGRIYLSWTDRSANEDGFRLEVAGNGGGPWNGSQVLPVNTAGLASEAPIDQQSCYRIIAFNAQGDSTPSNVACVTTIAAPTSLAATAVGQAAIDLSWRDNSTAEDGYEVNRGVPNEGSWSVIANLAANATVYRDATVAPDTSYEYFVRAKNGLTFSDWSNVVRASAASSAPDAPTVNVVPYGSWTVLVNCSRPPRTNEHRLERSADGGATWIAVSMPAGDCSAALDDVPAPEQQYCYRAFAINSMGESPASNVACTIPPACPCDLAATVSEGGIVNLTWTDNSAVETGYVVSRMLSFQEDWWLTVTLPPNETSMSDWPGGQDVYAIYQVVATVDGGQSSPAVIWVYVPLFPPFRLLDLTATPISSTQIRLGWADAENVAHQVRIERCTGLNCDDAAFAVIANLDFWVRSYTDGGLQPGTAYTYRVRSFNAAGSSEPATASATTP